MNRFKHTIAIILVFTAALSSFAAKSISTEASQEIDSFMNLRMELSRWEKPSDAIAELKQYKEDHGSIWINFSPEEKLILDNFYLMEEYNYLWNDSSFAKYLKDELTKQININESWISSHEKDPVNGWIYVLSADCISCYMSFNPVQGALKYGTKLKKYYEDCLSQMPKNSYCLTHMAQWFYWAPGISGGSKKKATELFEKGVTCALNDAELYYALIFLSQMQYDNGQKTLCSETLTKAEKIMPESQFIAQMKKYNSTGYSYFTGNKKKAEDEGRVSE